MSDTSSSDEEDKRGLLLWDKLFNEEVILRLDEPLKMDICALIERYVQDAFQKGRDSVRDERRTAAFVKALDQYEELEAKVKGEKK